MMPALGLLETRKTLPEGDFRSRDRLEIGPFRRVGEFHGAVEPVVVRERERRVAELYRAHRQFLGCDAPSRNEKPEWQCSST